MASSSSRSSSVRPVVFSSAASSATASAAEMPSLSRATVGDDRVAERLLVAEHQRRSADPARMIHLKPVGVSADGCPAAAAMTCISEPLTSDDAYVPRTPRRSSQSASSAPTSSPVSWRPPHDDRAAVGVRVLGDRDVGADPRRQGLEQVGRAGLLRVREGHRREPRVGPVLLRHAHRLGRSPRRRTRPGSCRHPRRASRCRRRSARRGRAPAPGRARPRPRPRSRPRRRPRGSATRRPAAPPGPAPRPAIAASISPSAGGTSCAPSPR